MSAFGHPLCIENGMLCFKVRHTLLLKCLITFVRYIWMSGRASASIYKPLMFHKVAFLLKPPFKFHEITCFVAPYLHRNWEAVLQGTTPTAA